MTAIRQRLAASMPGFVRKGVRMVEHYARRQKEWAQVLREVRGDSARDAAWLYGSAALAPFTSLRRLDGFEPPLFLVDIDVRVLGVGRFAIRHGTDDIIHVLPARERVIKRELEAQLRPGDTFIDAGANIGFYSVVAAGLVGPGGRVMAIEMMPPTIARLRDHLVTNAVPAEVIERALSDKDGEVVVATSTVDKFGQASIVAEPKHSGRATIRHQVETVRLDTALANIGPIRLIKMDLEGAEWLALCGAPDVLSRTERLVFESNSRDERIFALLREAGFGITPLGGSDYCAAREK